MAHKDVSIKKISKQYKIFERYRAMEKEIRALHKANKKLKEIIKESYVRGRQEVDRDWHIHEFCNCDPPCEKINKEGFYPWFIKETKEL